MKNWKWWFLGIILILFVPVIPYEKDITDGVVQVNTQSIGIYLYERYQTTQKKINEKNMNADKEPVQEGSKTLDAPVAQ